MTNTVETLILVLVTAVAALAGLGISASPAAALTWTPLPRLESLSATGSNSVTGLSCTPIGFCMAVDDLGRTFVWNGSWAQAPGISRTAGYVNDVSCVSASFCVAIGTGSSRQHRGLRIANYAVFWNGTRWGRPVPLYSGYGIGRSYTRVESVSCTSTTFCMVVGAGSRVWNGSRWRIYPHDLTGTDGQADVGCASSRFCIDAHDNIANYWTGSAWQSRSTDLPGGVGFIFSIACVSRTFCVAAGDSWKPLIWNGNSWSKSAAPERGDILTSVSCTSVSFCVAGDRAGRTLVWNGGSWGPLESTGLGSQSTLVGCTASACVALSSTGAAAYAATPSPIA